MEPLLTHVESVLFDLDGTLVETNIDFPLMKRKVVNLAAEYGMNPADISSLDTLVIVDLTVHCLTSNGCPDKALEMRHRAMNVLEEIELERAHCTQEIPYAKEVVDVLKNRGVGIGIVTRNCRKASEISLGITCITPDVLICREDTTRHKPHPEQIIKALETLGANSESSIMVGDHTIDIASGKSAGVKTIGFLREYRPAEFFDKIAPDFVARSLKEVLHAVVRCDS